MSNQMTYNGTYHVAPLLDSSATAYFDNNYELSPLNSLQKLYFWATHYNAVDWTYTDILPVLLVILWNQKRCIILYTAMVTEIYGEISMIT
jgi:hypothetical protein